MKRRVLSHALSLVVLASGGCEEPEVGVDSTEVSSPLQKGSDALMVPDAEIQLKNGNVYRFYDMEGAVGTVEAGEPGNPPILNQLSDAGETPATIFYALSNSGVELPDFLSEHHEMLVAEGSARPLDEMLGAKSRGWMAAELENVAFSLADCVDATFNSRHCTTGATYPNKSCTLNATNDKSFFSGVTTNYNAGVCVQVGTVHGRLSWDQVPTGQCGITLSSGVVWDEDFSVGRYRTLIFSMPVGGNFKVFTHTVTNASGDTYDFGNKWKPGSCA